MLDFKSFTENLGTTLKALTPTVTFPFGAAGWILLYIQKLGLIALPSLVAVSAWIVAVLCTCLFLTSLVIFLSDASRGPIRRARDRKRIQRELDYLMPTERQIISYLLAKQQRVFEVLPDGEEAATLIAKGFIVCTARRPPAIHRDITVEIPAHVWDVLMRNRLKFPWDDLSPVVQPWRTPWMAR